MLKYLEGGGKKVAAAAVAWLQLLSARCFHCHGTANSGTCVALFLDATFGSHMQVAVPSSQQQGCC